mmetsp:Transcript_27338/g.49663  ORF Transcript_27338/g.49663 Transcript_27338/m.49663 type:complete len:212 (-) Transcript_27338:258-893(-)
MVLLLPIPPLVSRFATVPSLFEPLPLMTYCHYYYCFVANEFGIWCSGRFGVGRFWYRLVIFFGWAINGGPDRCGNLDGVAEGTIGPFVSIDSANPAILVPLAVLLDGPALLLDGLSLLLPRVGPLRLHEWPLPPRPLPTVDSAPRPPSTTFSKYLHTWAEYLFFVSVVVAVVAVAVVKEDRRGRPREWWRGVVGIWRRREGLGQRGWRVGE